MLADSQFDDAVQLSEPDEEWDSESEEDEYGLEDVDIDETGSAAALTKRFRRLRAQLDTGTVTFAQNVNRKGPSAAGGAASTGTTTTTTTTAGGVTTTSEKMVLKGSAGADAFLAAIPVDRIRLEVITRDASGTTSTSRKAEGTKSKQKDKSDRATVEQVLDSRTRMILFKMLNNNFIYEINGCVSTGKEANVYHATTESGSHRAIKIYKTSILTFKDRDRYVTGEYRFRSGYNKNNPRKMVKIWAEKEMRNLKRLYAARIPCPEPLLLRMHVLVMGFIGDKHGWAAPRLKDAEGMIEGGMMRDLWVQCVRDMWIMYNRCKLVHGDLSEYNILYHEGQLYVIDVSQSVEHDHPHALEFLRKDCANVVAYFRRVLGGEQILTVRELFLFVTQTQSPMDGSSKYFSTAVDDEYETLTDHIREIDAVIKERPADFLADDERMMDEKVFQQVFIPRHMGEANAEDASLVPGSASQPKDQAVEIPAPSLEPKAPSPKALKEPMDSEPKTQILNTKLVIPTIPPYSDESESEEESESESESDGSDGSSEEEEDTDAEARDSEDDAAYLARKQAKMPVSKEVRKEHKKAIKESNREKRKAKVPKAVKKRKVKLGSAKRR
ncbi:serine/threonine-protein kinase RIO1 [Phlyctochytrium arcticum]|nr:serine/threonine-protein kinase RIO1 [Phlyctochytrium arcticum]